MNMALLTDKSDVLIRVALVTWISIGVLTLINKGPRVTHSRHTDSLQIQWYIHVFLQTEKEIFHNMIEMFSTRKQGQWLCSRTEGLSLQDEEGSAAEKMREQSPLFFCHLSVSSSIKPATPRLYIVLTIPVF